MKYGPNFMYLWPPRPETSIQFGSPHFEIMRKRATWRSNLKLNGQRNLIYISPERELQFWNRHFAHHLNYSFPGWMCKQILEVVPETGKWMVIDGELLHCKDASIKNTLYWWDLLVCDNDYMIGTTYESRHTKLRSLVKTGSTDGFIAKATENIWLAEIIQPEQYEEAWARTSISYVEGLMFKQLTGKLAPCVGIHNNSLWQVRCRKTTGRHKF